MLHQPIFGGYVITGLLGEGGMGAVYVAENAMLGKKLAVKLLHPHLSSNPHIVQRFVAEARAASAINHPHIIEVVDAAQLADGRWYIVLEFLVGQSLEEYVNAHGALAIDTALEILVQACAGLEAAHARPEGGIIHRDLKPENLFITSRPGVPRFVKVLDFGIAKLNDEILAGGMKTGSHMVMGTPGYMSHEQAKGSANVDHRTDIYAIGVIAYRVLTGRMPYAATSIGSLVAKQLTEGPPDPHELRADLPPGWVHTIRSAMSNEPHERPQTVRDFAIRLIEATPNGCEIAMRVASGFMQTAPAPGATVRVRGPAAGQPPAMPGGGGTVALKQPTTLSSAASEVPSDVLADEPAKRGARLPLALGLVALLAAGGGRPRLRDERRRRNGRSP